MTLENPTWLDATYVERVLQEDENDKSIEVSGVTVKAATSKGDNYASDMHRVAVEFSRVRDGHRIQERKSLIVKVAPHGDIREQMIEDTGIFTTEMLMMSKTLPRMAEILRTVCPALLSARCLHVQYDKPIHLVIEDLAPKGFGMADRHAGLDLDHCLLAIRSLGRFHASSIALIEKDPNAFTKYTKGMLHKDQPPEMTQFFVCGAKNLADAAANWPDLNPRIVEKLSKLSEVIYEKGIEIAAFREDEFNVLNHGDFWVNNMLFRYDEQRKPIDHIFVDFQISHYGSPAVDILYFLGTSSTNDIRLHHRDLLLQEYHVSLTNTMAELKSNTPAPGFEKLKETMEERAFLEVVAAMTVLAVVVLEKGEELSFTEMVKDVEEYKNPSYHGETYRRIMTTLLPIYDSKGLLDF